MQNKICGTCEETKALTDFYTTKSGRYGVMKHCKDCYKSRQRNPQTTEYRRLHRYKLTIESYEQLLKNQGGRCATCGIVPERFYIDHDHTCCPGTNTCGNCVRGLLCFNCNTALGQAKDNPAILLAMVDYLLRAGE